ncbi:CZB domain-containing protein [Nitrosophilus labii]|uniref:CZB domain-containing protein n=1 Tax=Nitrosophilus labii TaxID=2706014 RepID=UPI001FE73A56
MTKKQEDNTRNLSKEIEDINEELNQVRALAESLSKQIIDSVEHSKTGYDILSKEFDAPYTKILNAINDHAVFLTDITKVLDDGISKEFQDYTSCNFGKWYYSNQAFNELRKYGDEVLSILKDIEPHHKEVHNLAHETLRLKKEKKSDELFDTINKLAKSSNKLISELMKIYIIITSKERERLSE